MMQVPINKIIKVVAMWHHLMSTDRTMRMFLIMTLAVMIGCAGIRVGIPYRN